MPDLLIELLSEEIPARMQAKAAEDLRRLMTDGLVEAGLTYAHAQAFATPRRLTLAVEGLAERSRAVREERKGPRTDAPQQAIEGFLRATGLTLDRLERRAERKGEAFFAVIERPGREAAEIVAEVLSAAIRDFPWPKSMRWGEGSLRWVRPLQSILCLLVREDGPEVVPLEVEGLVAGNTTRGHRFHAPQGFSVTGFEDYEAKLKRAHVVLRAEERIDRIRHDAQTLAFARGLEVVEDEGLLREVAGLVEWPVTLMGRIEEEFLGLPPEVLRTSMKEHQKFLSVRNPATGRIEGFVTVANIEAPDHGATILAGNQRVLRARLSDARFFWENDLRVVKSESGEWYTQLSKVVFHDKLGSQYQRILRIEAIASLIADQFDNDEMSESEYYDLKEKVRWAASRSKVDLASEMVAEFPELQGTMGYYYTLASGYPEEVARACRDHYMPLGPSDKVPTDIVSICVALADKIDILTGFWAINEKPTGSKDPFALRRAALGVVRIIVENGIKLSGLLPVFRSAVIAHTKKQELETQHSNAQWDLDRAEKEWRSAVEMFTGTPAGPNKEALRGFVDQKRFDMEEKQKALDVISDKVRTAGNLSKSVPADLLSFLQDRLKVHLRDQGIRHDVIDACLAMPGADDLTLLVRRAETLAGFLKTEDGENLLQGFRRSANILAQAEDRDGVEYAFGADRKWVNDEAEGALWDALDRAEPIVREALAQEDFGQAMAALAALRAPIDAFFEAVQVNAENAIVRRNRLNLLSRIRALCLRVADLTKVEG